MVSGPSVFVLYIKEIIIPFGVETVYVDGHDLSGPIRVVVHVEGVGQRTVEVVAVFSFLVGRAENCPRDI